MTGCAVTSAPLWAWFDPCRSSIAMRGPDIAHYAGQPFAATYRNDYSLIYSAMRQAERCHIAPHTPAALALAAFAGIAAARPSLRLDEEADRLVVVVEMLGTHQWARPATHDIVGWSRFITEVLAIARAAPEPPRPPVADAR